MPDNQIAAPVNSPATVTSTAPAAPAGNVPLAPTAKSVLESAPTHAEGDPNAQNPAEGSAAAPDDIPETPEQAAKRGQSRNERKLARLHRERAEFKARAELAERRFIESQQQGKQDTEKPLTLADFNFDEAEFAKAVEARASEKITRESEAKRAAESQKQYQQRVIAGWNKKVAGAVTKYDDFAEVTGDFELATPALYEMMEADNGPDIAYYLGQHPDEADRIASLSVSSQIRAIGRLEAKLAATPPKPKTPSGAPEPIKPVGGSSGVVEKKLSEMTQDEFDKRRRAQVAARR